ncbi:MAG TPA: aspartate-semialdehyde dehydrogenase [Bacteroidales bacterium]|nr:aspartate-semialdehyde dehydrogenase [Bacteroidales bacterium]
MKLALVGATGLVGSEMMEVLEEQNFPCLEFVPAASEKSVGREVFFRGVPYRVVSVKQAVEEKPDIALFSAGGSVSLEWSPEFTRTGTYVIDNSSAWRMFDDVPLVVPEVNSHALNRESRIIANPNCSTIQLVVALWPLHKAFGLKRLVVSTYQSVTGTGSKAVKQMYNERAGIDGDKAYPWPIDLNCFPHGGSFAEDGYTTEELKLRNESRKILEAPRLKVTSTVVRIPVIGGHSEAVNIEFERSFAMEEVRRLLAEAPGVVVHDDPSANIYPMPITAHKKNEVFVGRIRRDDTLENGLNLWITADNLRKGAATNAVQIAQCLLDKGFLNKSW